MVNKQNRLLPSQNPQNEQTGFKFYSSELWKHLPAFMIIFTTLFFSILAMFFFAAPRYMYLVTAIFPLSCAALYFYSRYSSDKRISNPLKPTLKVIGAVVAVLILISIFCKPIWNTEIVQPITDFYPNATIDAKSDFITDINGNPILDQNGDKLVKQETTTFNNTTYRVEGGNLVDIEKKNSVATIYETWNILWTIALFVHCLYFRGKKGAMKFFLAALLYGFCLESGGFAMNFFFENDYNLYLPMFKAPIATMSGWAMVFYTSVHAFEMIEHRFPRLKRINPIVIGLIISTIALFRDLNVDPVATNLGLWTWHELLPAWYLGVPLINFTSWLAAVWVFGTGYTIITRKVKSENKQIVLLLVMIPVFLIISSIVNFNIAGIIEGYDGPAHQLRALRGLLG